MMAIPMADEVLVDANVDVRNGLIVVVISVESKVLDVGVDFVVVVVVVVEVVSDIKAVNKVSATSCRAVEVTSVVLSVILLRKD